MTLLAVEGLTVRFPLPRTVAQVVKRTPRDYAIAVDSVSFTVDRGETLAIVGESGSGKTSTAFATLGLISRSAGSVALDGVELGVLRRRELRDFRRRAQMIWQDPFASLDPRFTVMQTVEEPLLIHDRGSSRANRREQVAESLERAGLVPVARYLGRYPHQLSGGQRQRVAIAAALVVRPALLIADEPVSMLDASLRSGVLEVLDDLRRDGLGLLLITHDLMSVTRYSQRIAVMHHGCIVEQGDTDSVIQQPNDAYTKALLAAVPRLGGPRRRPTVTISESGSRRCL